MYRTIAQWLTSFFALKTQNEMVDRDIVLYGFEMMLSTFVTILLTTICGAVLGRLPETIVFLLFYCPLREYTGGFHAKSYIRCTCSFLTLYLLIVGFDVLLTFQNRIAIFYFITLLSSIAILVLAPVDTENKRLSKEEKVIFRSKSKILLGIEILMIIAGLHFDIMLLRFGALALMCIAIFLLIGVFKMKEDVSNEQSNGEETSRRHDEISRANGY